MTFSSYYNQLCGKMELLAQQARLNPDEDTVHDFRVSVRRWYQARQLAVHGNALPPGKDIRSINQCFKRAAGLRDIQVAIGLLKEIMNGTQYLDYGLLESFLKQEYVLRKRLKAILSVKQVVAHRLKTRISHARLRKYLRGELRQACFHIQQDIKLHPIRLLIKESKYKLEIWKLCFEDSPGAEYARKSFGHAQDVLGDWHDLLVLYGLVEVRLAGRLRSQGMKELLQAIMDRKELKAVLIGRAIDEARKSALKFSEELGTMIPTKSE